MNLDSLKNLVKSILEIIFDKISSSHIYNSLLESYQSLNMSYQRWIRNGFVVFCFLLVFSFPFSLFMKSFRFIQEVENKKDLIYLLLKGDSNILFQTSSEQEFQNQIDNILASVGGSPEQVRITSLSSSIKIPSDLKKLKMTGQQIEIQNLNIKQAFDIGSRLDQISPFTKVVHLKVEESLENENYFTATYSLIYFQNPQPLQINPLQEPKEET